MDYQLVNTGIESAEKIMKKDEELLTHLTPTSSLIIHFYDWRAPSATYGYFLEPREVLKSQEGIELARRPTGGGLLFHIADLAFSILIPSDHLWLQHGKGRIENYRVINKKIAEAVNEVFPNEYSFLESSEPIDHPYCMAKGTKYDVMAGDKKAIGAAQRQKKQGILHQGTISLALPAASFLSRFLSEEVVERMGRLTHAPLGTAYTQLTEVRQELQQVIKKVIEES